MTRSRTIAVAGVWLVSWVALWLSDADPSPLALAGIVVVLAGVGIVAVDLGRRAQTIRWPLPPEHTDLAPQRVPRTLRGIDAAVRSQPTELRRRLVDLVDDRLAARHGIDRFASPDAANDLLTPSLQNLLAGPPRRPPTERELWDLLNDIEAL